METVVKFFIPPGLGIAGITTMLDPYEVREAMAEAVEVTGPLEPGRNVFIERYYKTAEFDKPSGTSGKPFHGRMGEKAFLITCPGYSFALGSSKLDGWFDAENGKTAVTIKPEAPIRIFAEFAIYFITVCVVIIVYVASDAPNVTVLGSLLAATIALATLLIGRRCRHFHKAIDILADPIKRAEERPRPARSSRAEAAPEGLL